jgi:hypothetical protein
MPGKAIEITSAEKVPIINRRDSCLLNLPCPITFSLTKDTPSAIRRVKRLNDSEIKEKKTLNVKDEESVTINKGMVSVSKMLRGK